MPDPVFADVLAGICVEAIHRLHSNWIHFCTAFATCQVFLVQLCFTISLLLVYVYEAICLLAVQQLDSSLHQFFISKLGLSGFQQLAGC